MRRFRPFSSTRNNRKGAPVMATWCSHGIVKDGAPDYTTSSSETKEIYEKAKKQ
jgi:hypothetical protein